MNGNKEVLIAIYTVLWRCKIALKDLIYTDSCSDIIYGLFFIKLASYNCNKHRKELISLFGEDSDDVENKLMYSMRNIFYISRTSGWEYLLDNGDEENICEIIDSALETIEKDNHALMGSIPKEAFSGFIGKEETIKNLISEIDKINEEEIISGGNLITALRIIQRVCNYMF